MPPVLVQTQQHKTDLEGCTTCTSKLRDFECDTTEQLFRRLQSDYGRCTGRLYGADGVAQGWRFLHRRDCKEAITECTILNAVVVSAAKVPWHT